MAIRPRQILDSAVDLGKSAVSAAERRLRGGDAETDRPPSTPGTPAAKAVPKAQVKRRLKACVDDWHRQMLGAIDRL